MSSWSPRTAVPYGPNPWRQTSWDARAAANFICGGAGAGLLIWVGLAGVSGGALTWLTLAGLALVNLGLFSVSLELGRPLRAINVFRNPRTSWMSREAFAAVALMICGAGALLVHPAWAAAAALMALVFVACQANILRAARGIPAWREPRLSPLIVATSLAEGGGLFIVAAPLTGGVTSTQGIVFGALLVVRLVAWFVYRREVAAKLAPEAAASLERSGQVLQIIGTLLPLALLMTLAANAGAAASLAAATIAGVLAVIAGVHFKYVLVTRAGFNQGFALPRMPVRGTRA